MGEDPPSIGPTAKYFKDNLKMEPRELTLDYMKQQNQKLGSAEKIEEVERSIRKCEFPVLILGDNEKIDTPNPVLEDIQASIGLLGFNCAVGTHIHLFNKGRFESEVEDDMFDLEKLPKIILFVDGKNPATIGESKRIRSNSDLNERTIFFFDHNDDYSYLVKLAIEKKFPVEFKYPIPYHKIEELKGKALFGVLHCFYRYWRFKRNPARTVNIKNGESS